MTVRMQSCDVRKKNSIVVGVGFENDHGYNEITSIDGIKVDRKRWFSDAYQHGADGSVGFWDVFSFL